MRPSPATCTVLHVLFTVTLRWCLRPAVLCCALLFKQVRKRAQQSVIEVLAALQHQPNALGPASDAILKREAPHHWLRGAGSTMCCRCGVPSAQHASKGLKPE